MEKEQTSMAVYVDEPVWRWRGWNWCHLVADDLDELHAFARKLGLKAEWFQRPPKARYPHYDTIASRRLIALELGAVPVSSRVIVVKARLLLAQLEGVTGGVPVIADNLTKRPIGR